MTHINVVPPSELVREHLIAEYRELPRISKLAKPIDNAPSDYVLGAGHCKFFYDKGLFLKHRFENEIIPEMKKRGYTTNFTEYRLHPTGLNKDYKPTKNTIKINRLRIQERTPKYLPE